MRRLIGWSTLLLALGASSALADKGKSMLSIGISQGVGDYAGPLSINASPPGYLSNFVAPELGVNIEYWHRFTDDYAVALQGNYGFYSERREPGNAAAPGSQDVEFTSSSFKLRVGGDRIGKIGERFVWFMGPGVEFWNGKGTFKNFAASPNDDVDTESTNRWGISGRFGGVMKLSDAIGIQGQIGHTFGFASVEEQGAKITWYPSSTFAAWGLIFTFGG